MESTVNEIETLARTLPAISLEEMSGIRLMNRTDQKYVTNVATLKELLVLAQGSYFSQEIAGKRVSPYATTYWDDTVKRSMFRQHETGRKPRQKVRVRTYLNSNTTFLEIKKKDNHGKTAKSRIEVPSLQAVINEHAGADFVMQKTGMLLNDLAPAVGNRFNRITLVNNYLTEQRAAMDNIVVIELKRDGRCPSPILPLLRQLRIKPAGFSKYCVGASVTDPGLRINRFKKRLVKINKVAEKRPLEK